MELIYKEEAYRIIGACMEVYRHNGCGFAEPVYQECLGLEFRGQQIPVIEKPELNLTYKGVKLQQYYIPDFVCWGKFIVEIKSVSTLTDELRSQVHNYLKITGFQLGLLINFGSFPQLQFERIVHTRGRYQHEDKL